MHNQTYSFLIFICLLSIAEPCAATEESSNAEALFSRARQIETIWTDGTPSMVMHADIQVSDAKGSLVNGEYTLNWVSRSQWREEIRFNNYERLRVRDANGYWQKSGLSYQPEAILQLDKLLVLKRVLAVGSKQTLGNVKKREKQGAQQECVEVKWPQRTDRKMCFDESSGVLVSIEYPKPERHNSPQISRIEYGAFNAINGKLLPYERRALKDQKVIAV